MGIDLQKCKFFFFADMVDGGKEHTAAFYAHHSAGREVGYCDICLKFV